MENKLLQPLLQAGLLEIGDSDERLASIEKSIAELQKAISTDVRLLPNYTLISLDPNIADTEPVLVAVETIVATHWKALRAKFSERPIPILRAVILNALYNVGIADPVNARIIYLTATNFYPYAKLGREKATIEKMLTELGDLAEKQAAAEWSLTEDEPSLKLNPLKVSGFKFSIVDINQANLKQKLIVAANRSSGYNPWQHPDQWAEAFATHATEGISTAFKGGIESLTKTVDTSAIETSINNFFKEFKKTLDLALLNSFNSIRAVERRSKLLWWKETLYSPSLKDSYRQVDKIIQPVIMAFDLYEQLPETTPISVDYLLRDSLLMLNPSAAEQISFRLLLEEFDKPSSKALLKGYFPEIDTPLGRITVTQFFSLMVHGKLAKDAFKEYTGIGGTEEVSLTALAVIVLHDLLAKYLISE